MSETNERSVASDGSEAERPLGDPEVAVEILKLRVAELEQAIRRLADQDATLSVVGGNVIVEMDGTLTDEEREAVETSLQAMKYAADELGLSQADCDRMAAALRSLLERHCPVPENPPPQDNAPETHSSQSGASVRPECATISPPWMTRPFYVDPAAGWSYGFPKLYDPAKDGNMTAWLIANGYPKYLADKNLPCKFTAKIDSQ